MKYLTDFRKTVETGMDPHPHKKNYNQCPRTIENKNDRPQHEKV